MFSVFWVDLNFKRANLMKRHTDNTVTIPNSIKDDVFRNKGRIKMSLVQSSLQRKETKEQLIKWRFTD